MTFIKGANIVSCMYIRALKTLVKCEEYSTF
jgi:hypothetical protein